MSAARHRLESLCLARSVEEFRAWLDRAPPNARYKYAEGPSLDGQRDVVVLARALADAGEVTLVRARRSDGQFNYFADRLPIKDARPCGAAGVAAPMFQSAPPDDSDAGRVLALLAACADDGAPCPTNTEIARALRLRDAYAARYIIGQLSGAMHISIENRGQRITRVVTIIATGKATSAARTAVGKGFGDSRDSVKGEMVR